MPRFHDRSDAGRQLALRLEPLQLDEPIVIGLASAGVPVAREIARILRAALEVRVVRRLRPRGGRDVTLGAIAEDEGRWIEHALCAMTGTRGAAMLAIEACERAGLEEQVHRLGGGPRVSLRGRTVVIVDDALDARAPIHAVLDAIRAREQPARVVIAAPIAGRQVIESLRQVVDDIVAVEHCDAMAGTSAYYNELRRLPDDDARFPVPVACSSYPPAFR